MVVFFCVVLMGGLGSVLVMIEGVRWQLETDRAARDQLDGVDLAAYGGWGGALDEQLGIGVVDWWCGKAAVVWDQRIWYGMDSWDDVFISA